MKRVVAFFDMFDEIPENAKYLFSRKAEPSAPATADIENTDTQTPTDGAHIYIHYYEVDDMDFENLMYADSPFVKESNMEKMKKFMQKYKIPTN